ncbi:lipoprotein-anchoring transpeptidase ErfK/SrfK [Ancylobacter aquaticus]|uniref:Lipoprotein-anchoring transpeptidase ErfK/SrfK n=1 Tax=Ancylobacter aquaticus TaxID=100 RepID=A0A4R1I9D3_ANCAQ|nr:L,D-transpeptidase [Ancylobacter aquaticus]TCK31738.1 lipoprotein-anchoring transpeptidase ErfK/SrfK [Ancylobacter aquaticus]
MSKLHRRAILGLCVAGAAAALGGCKRTTSASAPLASSSPISAYAANGMYGPMADKFPIAAVDVSQINPVYLRREVAYASSFPPGTVVIDPNAHFLYLVQPGGTAIRYGVGVGKEGFGWNGTATINSKQEWPDWYPPKEMIQRRPDIQAQLTRLQGGEGVAGGLSNPLGARALYLWQNGRDTLYRIHGTLEPDTIGTNVSSGCIRMINQDAIDLYGRVGVGAKVVVLGSNTGA